MDIGGRKIPQGDFSGGEIPYFKLVRNFPRYFSELVWIIPRADKRTPQQHHANTYLSGTCTIAPTQWVFGAWCHYPLICAC